MTTAVERSLLFLLDGRRDGPVAADLERWLTTSPRFRAFAEANRDKVRKKLRVATADEAAFDVRAELHAAYRLLGDRRIELAFEPYGATHRGPDFGVRFRAHPAFTLEVTRLRALPDEAALGRVVLAKLRQLPPSVANLLLVAIPGSDAGAIDVALAMRTLRARVDAGDSAVFHGSGFDTGRAFYARYLRLGGVILWAEAARGPEQASLWVNASARIHASDGAVRACLEALRTGDRQPMPG
jgi:hypothetical protein